MRYIGDVHGKYRQYSRIIKEVSASIQVGDLGVGFRRTQGSRVGEIFGNPPHATMVAHNARFIRGNHDNPAACKNHSQWIPDGTIENDTMYIGGADSIDKAYRIKDYSWWDDEELSYNALRTMIDVYATIKPRIMVTHECPDGISTLMCLSWGTTKFKDINRTRMAFDQMWAIHRPELWVYGHWHRSFDQVIEGTRFVCLAQLEYKDIAG